MSIPKALCLKRTKKKYKNLKYLGLTYIDNKTNTYYSLFGLEWPIKNKEGKNYLGTLLYQHLDKLFISAYEGEDYDGIGHEDFFTGMKSDRLYKIHYDGKSFTSLGGFYHSTAQGDGSRCHLAGVPNTRKPISQGDPNAWGGLSAWGGAFSSMINVEIPPSWLLKVDNRFNHSFRIITIGYDKENSDLFEAARDNIFRNSWEGKTNY